MQREDEAALFALLSDPETMRFIQPPMDREAVRRFMAEQAFCEPPRVYALTDEEDRLLGQVIFHPWDETRWEIGWILARDVWGQGLATRATAALMDYGTSRGVRDFVLECDPAQTATARIAQKLGFVSRGIVDGLAVFEKRL